MNPPTASTLPAMTGPVLVWLMIQLFALLLAAARVPLCAGFAKPPESVALHEMVIAQIAVSAMLFPFLLRDWRTALVIACLSLPFIQLAGFLASLPLQRVALLAAFVVCWIICLSLWRVALPKRFHLIGVAAANALSVGGVVLWYVGAEFHPETPLVNWKIDALLGPIMAGMVVLDAPSPGMRPWLIVIVLVVTGAIAVVTHRGGKWKIVHWATD